MKETSRKKQGVRKKEKIIKCSQFKILNSSYFKENKQQQILKNKQKHWKPRFIGL